MVLQYYIALRQDPLAQQNASTAASFLPTLRMFADYLVEHGREPSPQLSTDDSMGASELRAGLSAKAAIGVGAFAKILSLLGLHDEEKHYAQEAKVSAEHWKVRTAGGMEWWDEGVRKFATRSHLDRNGVSTQLPFRFLQSLTAPLLADFQHQVRPALGQAARHGPLPGCDGGGMPAVRADQPELQHNQRVAVRGHKAEPRSLEQQHASLLRLGGHVERLGGSHVPARVVSGLLPAAAPRDEGRQPRAAPMVDGSARHPNAGRR